MQQQPIVSNNADLLTLQDWLDARNHSQSAVNSSGLIRDLARKTERIWNEARLQGQGTSWVNTHPIVQLYLVQLCHLAFSITPECDYHQLITTCDKAIEAMTPVEVNNNES